VVLSRASGPLFSYPDFRDYRERSQSFAGMAASNPTESSLDFAGESHSAGAEAVSANYPEVIGVLPFLGRWFSSEDEPAAVLSYRAWQRIFNGDANILGKRVRSETQWYTVVSVAPEEFTGTYLPLSIDLWVPFRRWAEQHPSMVEEMKNRARERVFIFGRLKPGVTPQHAAAELSAIAEQSKGKRIRDLRSRPALSWSASVAFPTSTLEGIQCLLVARGAARQRELSVRVALGAGRLRVLRQLMTEAWSSRFPAVGWVSLSAL
jgi:putative ABC transport system permease protein